MTDDDRKPEDEFGEHPPKHVCVLREPGSDDFRDLMVGALTRNSAPLPSSLSPRISPPISSINDLLIASPRPVPLRLLSLAPA